MGHAIDTTEVQQTKAASSHHLEPSTQDNTGSSVVSQLSNDYSSLPSNTPGPCLSCRQGHQSSPVDVQKFANPAPLGLCAFALTCFISSCISLNVRGIQAAGVSVSLALNYGGIAQVLAGMWEMAIGNTFSATSFCSYGAYWITFSLISTFDTPNATKDTPDPVCQNETLMGLFMLAWFIFTTLMLLCTLKSSLAMFSLFFFLDMNYLLLGIAHIQCSSHGAIPIAVQKAGGVFGMLAAFSAWYNAFAGIHNLNNGFFIVPLGHFPWSPAGHIYRDKAKEV
ncbi:GPR1/FUN34/yaaH [Penicillium camemberti]|uniref:GPR1/FUN34/yaaH n=1 Tax=Penicillium camemberti (strain FM 013) TaxID=1429867 RepID=A0A0G4PTY0_PENC3|nr:GPR1/FUN34/yaaH [Penicillium camemberti]